jgi:CheY-like chemotaxis protein
MSAGGRAAGEPGAGAVVLVADDDPDILELVGRTLERAGHEVITARDGELALELALEHQPDVAVLDLAMPGIDGHELTRRLRADERTRQTSVLVLTASAQERDRERSEQAGADAHVRKPFSPRDLAARVEELLQRAP